MSDGACKHDGAWLHDASHDSWACQLCGFQGSYADRSHARREAMVKEALEKSKHVDSEGRLVVGHSAATAYEQGQKLSDYVKDGDASFKAGSEATLAYFKGREKELSAAVDAINNEVKAASLAGLERQFERHDARPDERPKVAGSGFRFECITLEDWLKRLPDGSLLNVIKVGALTALRDPAGDQLYVLS